MIIAVEFEEFFKEMLSKLLWPGFYRALKQNQLKKKLLSADRNNLKLFFCPKPANNCFIITAQKYSKHYPIAHIRLKYCKIDKNSVLCWYVVEYELAV